MSPRDTEPKMGVTSAGSEASDPEIAALAAREGDRGVGGSGGVVDTGIRGKMRTSGRSVLSSVCASSG
ncbi:hypothetical protein RRF57_008861 [Xylaria bambusicola]|uniref:Uncharacterized protein n=1 Tax=Xylaria bambusicola TaxID=326684 RepID=A0AAN7UQ23_9PEZI